MFSKNKTFFLFLLIGLAIYLQSCKIMYPNRMFQEGNYEYFQVQDSTINQYVIAEGDLLSLEVFAREGFELVDVLSREENNQNSQQALSRTFLVEQNGFVELPIFGEMQVVGMTENELEDVLESKSAALFNDPYAVLRVVNRRAFIFKGSEASVVSLNQGPTSLLEVIAQSGGLSRDLKAYNIKIIRGDLKNPEIIEVDLSTIEGLQDADLIVQANDVVYVEERLRVARGVVTEITPIVSLLTSMATILVLVNR